MKRLNASRGTCGNCRHFEPTSSVCRKSGLVVGRSGTCPMWQKVRGFSRNPIEHSPGEAWVEGQVTFIEISVEQAEKRFGIKTRAPRKSLVLAVYDNDDVVGVLYPVSQSMYEGMSLSGNIYRGRTKAKVANSLIWGESLRENPEKMGHRPDSDFDPRDLGRGVVVERKEHPHLSPQAIKQLVKDHLAEDPDYYRVRKNSVGQPWKELSNEKLYGEVTKEVLIRAGQPMDADPIFWAGELSDQDASEVNDRYFPYWRRIDPRDRSPQQFLADALQGVESFIDVGTMRTGPQRATHDYHMQFGGRRGEAAAVKHDRFLRRLRGNPQELPQDQEPAQSAIDHYTEFHGVEPGEVEVGRLWVPGDLVLVGTAVDVGYVIIDPESEKEEKVIYVHNHESPEVKVYRRARSGERPDLTFNDFPMDVIVLGSFPGLTVTTEGGLEEIQGSKRKLVAAPDRERLVIVDETGVLYLIIGGELRIDDWIYN